MSPGPRNPESSPGLRIAFAEASDAGVRAAYRDANADLLRQRIDLGVALFLLVGISIALQEPRAFSVPTNPLALAVGAQIAICALAVAMARWRRVRERLPAVGALLTSFLITTILVQDVALARTPETITVGLVATLACIAALFPWGWRAQLGVSLVALLAFVAAEALVFGAPTYVHLHVALAVVAAATVAAAFFLDRYRFAAFQRAAGLERASQEYREEAEVSAALLEVAHTLGSAVGESDAFDRVNRLIVDLLGCDWSATITLDAETEKYRVAGLYGVSPDLREKARFLAFSSDESALLRQLEEGGMVEIEDTTQSGLLPPSLYEGYGVSAALAAPIVLGTEIVGAVTNGYRDHRGRFSRRHRRITAGVAQATAIAVENQRLIADLTRANRVKSEFLSTMSHELRTPVGVILGYARVLEDGDAGSLTEEQRDIVVRMRRSGTRLGELVDEILDLNRLESGSERTKVDWLDLDELVQKLDAEFRPDAEEVGLALTWINHAKGRRILTESGRLRTIVRHLVANAVKFTPQGEVRVEIAPSGASLVITVSDSGIGIAPEHVETIFEEFHQIDATDSREFGGVGLGLHLVRRLVDRLGGSVAVVSEPGQGSVFTVEIPAKFARAHGA